MQTNIHNIYFLSTPKSNKENWKLKCHISTQEDGQLTVYLEMRGKEGYRYYLDIHNVKGCIKMVNDDHPRLYMSKLFKQLG